MRSSHEGRVPVLRLICLTAAALVIHGYHLGVEDGEIYVPGARRLLHPHLYPFAPQFFLAQTHLSIFSSILAWTARLTHLSMDWTMFAWYVVSLFGLLVAGWLFAVACFSSSRARWTAIMVLTAVLAMPVADTALLLIDPYLTARSFSTPLTLFALASFLERRYARTVAAMLVMAAIHPLMVVYLLALIGITLVAERRKKRMPNPVAVPVSALAIGIMPAGFHLAPATGPYREVLFSRDYFFLYNWTWYHWLGLLGPLAILAFFWKANLRGTRPAFRRISFALVPFGLVSILVAGILCSSPEFEMFLRLQPLRSFHVITLAFVILFAGILGEYLAKDRPWVIAALCLPLAVGMFIVARATYPNSPQIELPSATSSNPWVNALLWIRSNTPRDAVFAVDSRYFRDPIGDSHGFRALSERSALADYYKDSGVVALFPTLAPEWKQMTNATYGLNHFTLKQFQYLRTEYPRISWTVIHGPAPNGMDCPYQRQSYSVCRMPPLPPGATALQQ